ncbi:class I SAM-dependent methyltransferase [Sphingomonas sp. BIUV-7]|uniref:Class I SAM-dependent methyltransferase n=1 Tax=Sphingomonas natans TaxID=3063330 RepID=A0ABT8Y6J0_9SPHN|nr:class I SAM-dependent methyltransferase [Sphingomonas sp. BIUV-7]MDO6413622.1 class I SAM-dependent methyltransferase [Sphingomonas sp. BIUV-7]
MKLVHRLGAAFLLSTAALAPAMAQTSIPAAVADKDRPQADKDRDADRKPAEMLKFAGVKAGMTVVDILPGAGYFTRLFSDVVGPKGKVIAYVPDEMLVKSQAALERANAFAAGRSNVVVIHSPLMAPNPPGMLADVVWTSQNYHDLHNMTGIDVVAYNRIVYAGLKPGGVYVVLDHVAPAGSGLADTGTTHRIDPATVKAEVIAAGFVFDGETKVLANPADKHDLKVFDPSLRGKTDQFVYRFKKPK